MKNNKFNPAKWLDIIGVVTLLTLGLVCIALFIGVPLNEEGLINGLDYFNAVAVITSILLTIEGVVAIILALLESGEKGGVR